MLHYINLIETRTRNLYQIFFSINQVFFFSEQILPLELVAFKQKLSRKISKRI